MALSENRKISILIGGFFLVGLIAGLFFSRLSQEKKQTASLSFSTQSIGNEFEGPVETFVYACPWSEEILAGNRVLVGNPLEDKASSLLSIQQGLLSENYTAYGPVAPEQNEQGWKASLTRNVLDNVQALWEGSTAVCVYSKGSTELFSLRQSDMGSCEAKNTPYEVGFVCE